MKFQDLSYKRPDQGDALEQIARLQARLESASAETEVLAVLKEMTALHNDISSMASLCYIRHSIDTTDPFYKTEMDYFDESMPVIMEANQKLQVALLQSPWRACLEQVLGAPALKRLELSTRTISSAVLDDLVQENKLESEYTRLLASAKLEFDGKTLNLQQMGPYLQAPSREVRRAAVDTIFGFYAEHDAVLDEIYDRLVKRRHKIAVLLGFDNFVDLGYARMGRTDYDSQLVATYREQVKQTIVPIARSLREKQRVRLGLEQLCYYDEPLSDPKGNPAPVGDADRLVDKATVMFKELSPAADEFFTFMKEAGAMDLLSKPGKETGGYCTFLPNWRMPFIFANFNGTKDDVEVFTHEGGHAYQAYVTRDNEWLPYQEPGMETAEIHSMSMEFLTWPWMDLFFEAESSRFRYNHLADALMFIPYGAAVDHYQHLVYEKPEAAAEERRQFWLDVEALYLPWRDYADNAYLQAGNVWKRQTHIYTSPFYYIDYTLAQVLALDAYSIRFKDRAESLPGVSDLIRTAVSRRTGNYLVFVPSFAYLKQLRAHIEASIWPKDWELMFQTPGMSNAARAAYLNRFNTHGKKTLAAFSVIGSLFNEGVDLAGDRLIGVVVVGTGLPGLSPARSVMGEYYQQRLGDGFRFAYVYPGFNRVLQAAGRLIRSETDRGFILLIDDRYKRDDYQRLLPEEWQTRQVGGADDIARHLDEFWSEFD